MKRYRLDHGKLRENPRGEWIRLVDAELLWELVDHECEECDCSLKLDEATISEGCVMCPKCAEVIHKGA